MYIVQGIVTKLSIDKNEIKCYNILDTEDCVAEDVNIELIDKNDLVFGDCLPVSVSSDYGRLFYGRCYRTIGVDEFKDKQPLVMCETKKTWNILKVIDGVVIDNSFSLHYNDSTSIILRKNNDGGSTKIWIKLEKLDLAVKVYVYVDKYLCYTSIYNSSIFNGKEKLGVCEIEQFKLGTNIIYRIHIPIIGGKDGTMYDDLYFDLDIKDETLWFKGDNPAIPLNTINNMKKKLGGML